MTELGKNILKLRKEGMSYTQISQQLNCSKSTVSYHCNPEQKCKNLKRTRKYRSKLHPYLNKLNSFQRIYLKKNTNPKSKSSITRLIYNKLLRFNGGNSENMITLEQIIKKFGENPKCYLTGQDIDISKPSTYQFDHIIPRSRGGDNSIDNLGICTKQVNQAKHSMTPDEFINMCKNVVKYKSNE